MRLDLFQAAACLALTAAVVAAGGAARSQSLSITRGQAIAARNCAQCHAIGLQGDSPHASAPPLRDLHKRFAVDDLEAGVLSDLLAGHPAMPRLRFSPSEIHDLLDYLKSLGAAKTTDARSIPPVG